MPDTVVMSDERLDTVNEQIKLIQKKDGLTFGTDAFLLAAFIKQQKYSYAIELGAGTGIISLLCASAEKFKKIDCFEIQKDFCDVTKRNIEYNGLCEKVKVFNEDIRNISSSLLESEADVVFSNPPYMRTDSGKRNESDRKYIARHEVCGDINDFCAAAYRVLKHGGKFYCVWRPDRLVGLLASMRANRLEPKTMVSVHGDVDNEPSMVLVSSVKGGAEGMKILPPLFLYEVSDPINKVRIMTEQAKKIYETMNF
ncbi:MAG: methyltransferase [Clostridia bacterium]|nr:methyltransferase [Clostridia bacterium]